MILSSGLALFSQTLSNVAKDIKLISHLYLTFYIYEYILKWNYVLFHQMESV